MLYCCSNPELLERPSTHRPTRGGARTKIPRPPKMDTRDLKDDLTALSNHHKSVKIIAYLKKLVFIMSLSSEVLAKYSSNIASRK